MKIFNFWRHFLLSVVYPCLSEDECLACSSAENWKDGWWQLACCSASSISAFGVRSQGSSRHASTSRARFWAPHCSWWVWITLTDGRAHFCNRLQASRQNSKVGGELQLHEVLARMIRHYLLIEKRCEFISSPPNLGRNYPTELLKVHFCPLVSNRVGVFLLEYLVSEKLALRNHYLNDRLLVHRNSSTFNLSLPSMSTFQTLVVKKATITTCTVMLTGEVSNSNNLAFS